MPSIIKDDKQTQALQEIVEGLDTAKQLDTILTNPNATFQLSMVPEKGRAIHITVPEGERDAFLSLAEKMKAKLAKSINSKASRYRIALSADEMSLLGPATKPRKAHKEPKSPSAEEQHD